MKVAFSSSQRCTFRDGTVVEKGINHLEEGVLKRAYEDEATRDWFEAFFSPVPEAVPPPVPGEEHAIATQGAPGPEVPVGLRETQPEPLVEDHPVPVAFVEDVAPPGMTAPSNDVDPPRARRRR